MTAITSRTLANGLPLHTLQIDGTRAVTALIAFDAGARAEHPEENGIAHFLEHLVFKGGEKYDHYQKVNETAERMGAVLNAYTSHDIVAFHITVAARRLPEALDLLTDFVARPLIPPDELERERGVVIQEIARADDQPSVQAEHEIDRAAFGDHPLGRPVLGPAEHLRTFTRDQITAFRDRRWSGARGGVFLAGNLSELPRNGALDELFGRFAERPAPEATDPAPEPRDDVRVVERDSNQSHLRLLYRPSLDATAPAEVAALTVYSTILGGSMGSRLFEEIREKRGLAYSVYSYDHAHADTPVLQLGAGLDSSKCIEAYGVMRGIVEELAAQGPREEEVERAKEYAYGRRLLAFENTTAVARHAASQSIVHEDSMDPDVALERLEAVSFDEVAAVARAVPREAAVACVGPHSAGDFAY